MKSKRRRQIRKCPAMNKRKTLSDRQADIMPFLPIRSCSQPSSSSLLAASNGWSVAAVCQSCCGSCHQFIDQSCSPDVKFPTDQQSMINNKLSFHSVVRFPNVVGAIDCTHIAIKAPSEHEGTFVNHDKRAGCVRQWIEDYEPCRQVARQLTWQLHMAYKWTASSVWKQPHMSYGTNTVMQNWGT